MSDVLYKDKDQSQLPAGIQGLPFGGRGDPDDELPPGLDMAGTGVKRGVDTRQRDAAADITEIERQKVAASAQSTNEFLGLLDRDRELVRRREEAAAYEPGLDKPWNAEEQSKKFQTDPIQAFGSLGSVFGMIASAFTRAPMENALNASAAAMQAVRAGDEEAYNRAHTAWKENTELAFKRHQVQREAYHDALDLMNTDMNLGLTKMKMAAAQFDDQKKLALINQGYIPELFELVNKENDTLVKQMEAANTLTQQGFNRAVLDSDLKKINKDPNLTPEQKAAHRARAFNHDMFHNEKTTPELQMLGEFEYEHRNANGGEGPTFDERVGAWEKINEARARAMRAGIGGPGSATRQQYAGAIAKAIESGEQPPDISRLYGMTPDVRVAMAEDHFDLAKAQLEWKQAERDITSLHGPQMMRLIGLSRSVDKVVDEVSMLSQELNLRGIPIANQVDLFDLVQRRGNTEEGQLATKYLTAVNTLKAEFANAESGGYAPHEEVWQLAKQQINGNYSVDQMSASLHEIQRLLRYRIKQIPGIETLGPGAPNRYEPSSGATAPESALVPPGWKIEVH